MDHGGNGRRVPRRIALILVLVVVAAACDDAVVGDRGESPAPGSTSDERSDGSASGDAEPVARAYGAGGTGPAAEACETDGTRVGEVDAIAGAGTFLLGGGRYGSMSVPPGATVKPYDCQRVLIGGMVSLGDGSTLAGVTVQSDTDWALLLEGENIEVRNNVVNGGAVEAVRIGGDASDVTLVGNTLDGGRDHHVVKVDGTAESGSPDNIVIRNNRFTKEYYDDSSEDLLQLEGHNQVEITENTFSTNPRGEDGIDVKQGIEGALIQRNHFEGSDIAAECLLVQGGFAENIVRDNFFEDCNAVSLGAHPEERLEPWWRFEGNRLENSTLRVRRSRNAEIVGVEMVGGTLQLGLGGHDDTPRELRLTRNRFVGVTIDNNLTRGYTCADNVLERPAGDSLACTGTDTAQP